MPRCASYDHAVCMRICLQCGVAAPTSANYCAGCGASVRQPVRFWQAGLVGALCAVFGGFAMLFSMGDGGFSTTATLWGAGISAAAGLLVPIWFLWLGWQLRQARARRRLR